MTDPHPAGEHHGPTVMTYIVIFAALAVFTIISFVANGLTRTDPPLLGTHTSFAIILSVAVIKATLVGMYFMHLKFDWGRVGFMIVPAFILAVMMMFVLMPDIVLAWRQ
jgi:cytochrome c oxidase subunit 4